MSSVPRPILESLLTPGGVQAFLDGHWPERYFVAHGDKARLPAVFLAEELNDFEALARRYQGTVSFFSGPKSPHMVPVEGVNPGALYRLGLSVYLTDIGPCFPDIDPVLRALERELGINPGCARAGVFASPNSDGIHCHYDAVDIFSIQLRGTKRWRLARVREIPFPWGKQYIPGNRPIDDLYPQVNGEFPDWRNAEFEDVDVRPGSVLYMPRGTWHQTEVGEDSIAVSIGMTPPSAAEVVLEQLRLTLLQDPKWRKPLYGAWGEGDMRDKAVDEARELVSDLPRALDDLAPSDLPLLYAPEQSRIAGIDERSRFRRTPNTRLLLDKENGEAGGETISAKVVQSDQGASRTTATIDMPPRYAPVLRWIADSRETFGLNELMSRFPLLGSEEAIELAQVLASAKVLKLLWFPERSAQGSGSPG